MVETPPTPPKSTLRHRILAFVIGLVVLSLLGSVVSLYRITEVNQVLGRINRGAVPLSKLVTQMESDAEILQRELERGLGASHWGDPRWKPRPVPRWIEDVLQSELERMQKSLDSGLPDLDEEARARWAAWSRQIGDGLTLLRGEAQKLYVALSQKDETSAAQIYPRWESALQEWRRHLAWGVTESDRSLRGEFSIAHARVASLRTALEVILFVVMALSLLLLWLGERALRPLGELTRLAQEITRRGLRKEDKALLPDFVLGRSDEVSGLAREFHRMATTLLEREKLLEIQNQRIQDQNTLLREAEHMAAIGRMSAQVAHEVRNPLHSIGLEAEMALELAQRGQAGIAPLKQGLQSILGAVDRLEKITENYLRLSKPASSERTAVDVGELLEEVLATYTPQCEEKGVRVDWRLPSLRLLVSADRALLEQVLGNLMRNALQAVDEVQGRREIRWSVGEAESGRIWIQVEDTGKGVPEEAREKLFTPFFTTRAQGTGLGLAFAKRVIEQFGGQIHFEQGKAGGGARFKVVLPALTPEVPTHAPKAEVIHA